MARILVTVGTDGYKDWVQTPDGQKFALGTHTVLGFVTKLCRSSGAARKTLDTFLKAGAAMLTVDDDRMWTLLAPRRARWAASDGSFMSQDHRHLADLPQRTTSMDTLPKILTATENVVAYCSKQAAAGKPINPNAFKDLGRIASDLRKQANQSDNSAFYGLGAPKLVRPEDGFANDGASPAGLGEMNKAAELTFDTYESNLKVAEDVLAKSKATLATINKLAAAGKKFNHTAARADVAKVANRVASLCEKTALTEEWVAADLSKLAAETTRLYKLFHPKS